MDNVVDIASKRDKQQGNCEHNEVCPHCAWADSTASNFIDRIQELDVKSDAFREEIEELIGYVEWVTQRQTLGSMINGLIEQYDELDGVGDE